MMRKFLHVCICFATVLVLLNSCASYSDRKSFDIMDGWRISTNDSMEYASPSYDDSGWEQYALKSVIKLHGNGTYFWMRKTIDVPTELSGEELWFGFSKNNIAADAYADGIYIGNRGSFPPAANVRTEVTNMIHIPSSCIHDGKVTVALHAWAPQDTVSSLSFFLGNTDEAHFTNLIHAAFNQRLYFAMAVLCLFISFYAISQYVADKTNSFFLSYALSLFFISIYFYDMGSDNLILPYILQRVISRICLPVSINFVILFLMQFFKRNHFKTVSRIVYVANFLTVVAYFLVMNNSSMIDLFFLLFLLPIFATIVYGIIVTVHALRSHVQDTLPIFIGFIVGSAFGIHDIVCMVLNYIPFLWLQGLSFFCLNISIFITVSSRAARMKREVEQLATVSSAQSDKLSVLFKNAKQLSAETNEIVTALNTSVVTVAQAAQQSAEKVGVINGAIAKQKKIREETREAVNGFASSLATMSKELEDEASTIQKTASDTSAVIKGIDTVGSGISTAADFASSLSDLTHTGSKYMRSLSESMDIVQQSSSEILSVANALDDFAQQTDLLAMNASIEAAHAGVAGKGFAVIAHEIKTLAAASSQRSTKIGEIVQSISSAIANSVELSEKVNKTLGEIQNGAVQSAEKVEAAAQGMKIQLAAGAQISDESSVLAKSASRMMEESQLQKEFSAKVTANMDELSSASMEVDRANADISSGSKELEEQSRALTSLAERTKRASQELAQLMAQ
jgi:methyl-accepting chemotaxis protein